MTTIHVDIDYSDTVDTIEVRHEDYIDYADALSVTYEVLSDVAVLRYA